ncbi:MAG: glycosyltransferase family 9 protein [Deltaproteobacteria bacterium]|nr:glycosyltransferase family 9 protein [Deltaproteobacteria bacterium]
MAKEKVLIIKLGYSETLVSEISRMTSLGDVLRSTVLLSLFKEAHVTWLVDEKAVPLLKGNPLIARIMPYDLTTALQLKAERFDTVVNLEKVAGICAFADSLTAWKRYGFTFDPETGTAQAYDGSQQVLDICLNNVGEKWPIKAWPLEYWKELEALIGERYSVSWQRGLTSIEEYMEWINSCSLIVTNDSLGLHIAHALDKKIVALFGPTISSEVYVKNGVKLLPEKEYDCLPCLDTVCVKDRSCMYEIRPQTVMAAVEKLL